MDPRIRLMMGSFPTTKEDRGAFNALLEYERQARVFDSLTPKGQSVHIPNHLKMNVFAEKHNTTVKKMKSKWKEVELYLEKEKDL